MLARISQYKEKLSAAKTAKLWFQYLCMVETMRMVIKVERTGNFDFHRSSFIFSGHHLYARLAHIYLQKMQNLEGTNKKVYERFQNGYRVVRRSQRCSGGLSIDLIIEQITSIM